METHFLSSSVKKSKTEINREDALNPLLFHHYRWIFLCQAYRDAFLQGSLYLRQVERRTRWSVGDRPRCNYEGGDRSERFGVPRGGAPGQSEEDTGGAPAEYQPQFKGAM
ncbi:hypothetical protein MKW98_022116 [Papaver atlanticum]|uniref:Uncharacterized protein n=1 Tax=Papaver atlanticum TaxID=357466 RepID=A0AAD4THV6_9MAGN|nr:hypothetical protein MKW98_022116 [Papaver atlanticum]